VVHFARLAKEVHMKNTFLFSLIAAVFAGCGVPWLSSYDFESVNEARSIDQISVEDSSKVFFVSYPNPFPDKEFLWFAVFDEGPVEMHVHDLATDSLLSVYHFEKQDVPVYTIAVHEEQKHLTKCVVYVSGRMKCAKVYPVWRPINMPQFPTDYTIDQR
jgi:hypothetical protein